MYLLNVTVQYVQNGYIQEVVSLEYIPLLQYKLAFDCIG